VGADTADAVDSTGDAHRLVAEITHCNYVVQCKAGYLAHPCRKVVDTQPGPLEGVQVPEPWSGHVESAPILFIASNPSISFEELYPTWDWPAEERVSYFADRFAGGVGRVEDGVRFPRSRPDVDGRQHSKRPVAFWSAARNCASLILGRPAHAGTDYALTEVVHCKSRAEQGVADALDTCTSKWLPKILDHSRARALIVYGDQARRAISTNLLGNDLPVNRVGEYSLAGRSRFVVTLRHPNYRGVRRIDKVLPEDEWNWLRSEMNEQPFAATVVAAEPGTSEERFEQVWPKAGTPTLLMSQGWFDGAMSVRLVWTASGVTAAPSLGPGLELLDLLGYEGDRNNPRELLAWAKTTGWDLYPAYI
jgi:hypothetical protein